MIFKSDLIEAINGVSHDMTALAVRVSDLEKRLNKLEKKASDKNTEARLQNLEDFMDTQTRINNEVPIRMAAKPCDFQKTIGEEAVSCALNDAIEEAKKKITKLTKSANVKKQPRTKDGKFAKKK